MDASEDTRSESMCQELGFMQGKQLLHRLTSLLTQLSTCSHKKQTRWVMSGSAARGPRAKSSGEGQQLSDRAQAWHAEGPSFTPQDLFSPGHLGEQLPFRVHKTRLKEPVVYSKAAWAGFEPPRLVKIFRFHTERENPYQSSSQAVYKHLRHCQTPTISLTHSHVFLSKTKKTNKTQHMGRERKRQEHSGRWFKLKVHLHSSDRARHTWGGGDTHNHGATTE